MVIPPPTIYEVDFCSQVASAINLLIAENPAIFPFHEARVEGLGTGAASRRRKDLRFYDRFGKLVLCGEVKLPGTPDGQSAVNQQLVEDAAKKADDAVVPYFFTWNVNEFVLWDRSLWDKPWYERRVRLWRLSRNLAKPEDVAREENLALVKTQFLPDLLRDLADIISGRRRDWAMPPDDIFLRSLESHLNWPVQLLAAHILQSAGENKSFDLRVQRWMSDQDWTFVRTPQEQWVPVVDNMARTLAYVWANRLIFYKALRSRFRELPRLELRPSVKKPEEALAAFNRYFDLAVWRSGDYESLLMPEARDWATELVFHPAAAIDAWRGLLRGIEAVDFGDVPSDVVGKIFQKLIGPDERHRYGQHFTGDDAVDLINSFCIRNGEDTVLDPSCGSGSFLVRAYYRKRHLDRLRPHANLIGELFGCDIAMYPAHLATLNLAAREINDQANYPRIVRRNFFDFAPPAPFCEIPDNAGGHVPIPLPALDAVVGNPPYVRQENVQKADKARYTAIAAQAWPDLHFTGRADLHCYFWPAAARLLKPGGYFGFLTSSSWLDVEYGFALQGWILRHFNIVAIMESAAEPWFEDARVKTCATILQRCESEAARMANRVRFVRFSRTLSDIIGIAPTPENENDRQEATDKLRQRILAADADFHDQDMRIIVKTQRELWDEGVGAATILGDTPPANGDADSDENGQDSTEDAAPESDTCDSAFADISNGYRAGKWGRYVRAPDFYFDIMRQYAGGFVALGAITDIRFGIKTGCDDFFMPKDVTAKMLADYPTDRLFRQGTGGAPRRDVESGKLKIILAGDGSVHPVETKYLAPELHSMMKVERPVVCAAELDRLVLLVSGPMEKLKARSPWVWRYLRHGMTATFPSTKSKPVPVPRRSTCAGRDPWYDLTRLVRPGFAFWPMAQQYRHIIAANPERVICNHNLFDLAAADLTAAETQTLTAVLNSTLIGLFKTFYGRYAGTEGNLKTEVVDVNLLLVPDPRRASPKLARRLADALARMCGRNVGRLVEEQLMDCHTPDRARRIAAGPLVLPEELQQSDRRELDDAVFELLGVAGQRQRSALIDRLYQATALHFREIRVVEINKMRQRAKAVNGRFRVYDLAADIWDAATLDDVTPLAEWVARWPESDHELQIPEPRPVKLADNTMFDSNTVYFGKAGAMHLSCTNCGTAELVARLAGFGVCGSVRVPQAMEAALKLLDRLNLRQEKSLTRLRELTESRTSDERIRAQLLDVLERWFVAGREMPKDSSP